MIRALQFAASMAMAFFIIAPAHAKVGDPAWASCVWSNAPKSADAWLQMKTPSWTDNLETTSEILGFRLIAICEATSADEARPNHIPNWKALQSVLKRARPEALGGEADNPQTLLCSSYAVSDEKRALFKIDVVQRNNEKRTIVFQQFFDQVGGSTVRVVDRVNRPVTFQLGGVPVNGARIRMPQDLRAMPIEGATEKTECKAIRADGSLADA